MNKKMGILGITLAAGFILGGCGTKAASTKSADSNVKTIVVGTSGMPKPFTYADENGKLAGYDIDTVRALDKELKQYKFEFKKTEITSVLAGLDAGRFQIGANNFGYNDERAEKYLYTKPTFQDWFVLVVRNNNQTIKQFADVAGKTTVATPGVNFTMALEKFNKTASTKTKITYSQEDPAKQVQDISSGKYDYALIDKPLFDAYKKEFKLTNLKGLDLSTSDEKKVTPRTPYSYLLVSKTDGGQQLVKDLNKAIVKIQADGTQAKISQKYFGEDYVPGK
ncbi:transporter substrate-binding domain-containing protein [Periweissella cryptocerci]|nr:transporter substrate-binding domain-containing protein [Periweissella cryptocerci]